MVHISHCTQLRYFLESKKNFRPQTSDDETLLADQTDFLWDPERSRMLFFSSPSDISCASIANVSVHKDDLRVTLLTTDTSS